MPRLFPPLRLPRPVSIVLLLASAVVAVPLLAQIVPWALLGQALMVLVLGLTLREVPALRRGWATLPAPHRIAATLLLGGMIVGHFGLQTRSTYPFVAWAIFPFAQETDPVTCRQLIATTVSGQRVRLLVEQLVPSIVQFSFPDEAEEARHPGVTGRLVAALVELYNRGHARDPVDHVDLMRASVHLHPPARHRNIQPSCELLRRYDFLSARSS